MVLTRAGFGKKLFCLETPSLGTLQSEGFIPQGEQVERETRSSRVYARSIGFAYSSLSSSGTQPRTTDPRMGETGQPRGDWVFLDATTVLPFIRAGSECRSGYGTAGQGSSTASQAQSPDHC